MMKKNFLLNKAKIDNIQNDFSEQNNQFMTDKKAVLEQAN